MSNLKNKTIIIVFENKADEIEEQAVSVYKKLKGLELNAMFGTSKNQLALIGQYGYDLVYLFLYDGKEIVHPSQGDSLYHLYDVTQPNNYRLEDFTRVFDAVAYFEAIEEELSNV